VPAAKLARPQRSSVAAVAPRIVAASPPESFRMEVITGSKRTELMLQPTVRR